MLQELVPENNVLITYLRIIPLQMESLTVDGQELRDNAMPSLEPPATIEMLIGRLVYLAVSYF